MKEQKWIRKHHGDYFTTTDDRPMGFTVQGPCREKHLSQRIEDAQLRTTSGLARFRKKHRIVEDPACGTRRSIEIHELEML